MGYMKKIVGLLLAVLMLNSCADSKTFKVSETGNFQQDYLHAETYGLFNESQYKNPNVKYELSVGNVVWGIILVETIVAPVYFFGFSLYEPVALKECSPNCK